MIEAGDDTAFLNEGSIICLNLSSNDLNDNRFEITRKNGQNSLHTFKSMKKRSSPAKKAQPHRKRQTKMLVNASDKASIFTKILPKRSVLMILLLVLYRQVSVYLHLVVLIIVEVSQQEQYDLLM